MKMQLEIEGLNLKIPEQLERQQWCIDLSTAKSLAASTPSHQMKVRKSEYLSSISKLLNMNKIYEIFKQE